MAEGMRMFESYEGKLNLEFFPHGGFFASFLSYAIHNPKRFVMIIAVDFDGTIVEHCYPAIGKERPFATDTLKRLMSDGHQLMLWSVREGRLLDEAVEWCRKRGVVFHAVNGVYLEDSDVALEHFHCCRKPQADMFIDDRNVGGLPDWGIIYEIIRHGIPIEEYYRQCNPMNVEKKKRWFKFRSCFLVW